MNVRTKMIESDLETMLTKFIFLSEEKDNKDYLAKARDYLEGVKSTFPKYEMYDEILKSEGY